MTQNYNKIFPIKTDTACNSKWAWSTIWLNKGETSSCHRVDSVPLDPTNFNNFHNLPKKIQDRELMLQGKWPKGGCEYCQQIEEAGGHSDRQHNNAIGGYVPIELETDITATNISPTIVEIFARNTCNLKCIYCAGDLSSQIEAENKKFGYHPLVPNTSIISADLIDNYLEKFFSWLEDNIQGLGRLHLLGGETFLQKDLIEGVFDIIERKPNPNLQLNIFSNFNVPTKLWYGYLSQIKDYHTSKNIGRFDLTCSVDCWGPEQEYVRSGLDLTILEEYLAWAAEQSEDWLYLNVNQTVSSMTIKTMPELIEKIKQYNKHRHIGHYFMFVTGERYLHPDIFEYSMWEEDFNRILTTMSDQSADDKEALTRMIGLQKRLQNTCKLNQNEINKLHQYLDELDRRRGTNWRDLFPYLIIN
jgi:hypothetical protein